MHRIRAKLHSSSGASMVFALMFLLLCTTVGAVILTAASANAGRLSRQRAQQQDYLTVSSAAELVRNELEGLSFTGREQQVCDSGTGETEADYLTPALSGDALPALVGSKAEEVLEAHPVYVTDQTGVMPADVTLTVTANGFDDVAALLSIDGNYNLTITFSFAGGSSGSYPLTLIFPAAVDDSTATTVTTDERSYTVWEDVDGVLTPITYIETYDVTTVTRTVTVTWSDGIISRRG